MTVAFSRSPAVQLSLFIAVFFAVWSVRATLLTAIDEQIRSPFYLAIYSNLVKFLIWVVSAAFFVSRFRAAAPIAYLGVSAFPRARTWLLSFVVITTYLAVIVFVETVAGSKQFSASAVISLPLALFLLQFCITPILEEVLFRGFVLKELLALLPSVTAILISSLLFALIHLPYWLSHAGATPAVLLNFGGVFVFGLLAGWLYARSVSIWPSVLAHMANNLLAVMLVAKNA